MPLQVRAKIGGEAYSAVRDRILEHMETFVENIYDLHRLTRRQHHLESICEDKEKYAAELHRLVSPSAELETAGTENVEAAPEPAAEAEKVHEVPVLPLSHLSASLISCILGDLSPCHPVSSSLCPTAFMQQVHIGANILIWGSRTPTMAYLGW